MSHRDYIAKLDEGQLVCLIEMAQARVTEIRSSGWVKLWTVSIGWTNRAWFAEPDHAAAVAFATKAVGVEARRYPSTAIEMEIKLENYRPEEIGERLASAAPQPQEQS